MLTRDNGLHLNLTKSKAIRFGLKNEIKDSHQVFLKWQQHFFADSERAHFLDTVTLKLLWLASE